MNTLFLHAMDIDLITQHFLNDFSIETPEMCHLQQFFAPTWIHQSPRQHFKPLFVLLRSSKMKKSTTYLIHKSPTCHSRRTETTFLASRASLPVLNIGSGRIVYHDISLACQFRATFFFLIVLLSFDRDCCAFRNNGF